MVIGESKVRAMRSEYDGLYSVAIERLEWRGSWERIATFADACCPEHALNQAREAGWAWLVDQ